MSICLWHECLLISCCLSLHQVFELPAHYPGPDEPGTAPVCLRSAPTCRSSLCSSCPCHCSCGSSSSDQDGSFHTYTATAAKHNHTLIVTSHNLNLKGSRIKKSKFPRCFDIRGHCTIKTSCKFQNSTFSC